MGHDKHGANTRASSEGIRRWIEVDRSNGAGEFRYPEIVQTLTRGKVVSDTVLLDMQHVICGIAGVQLKTADRVEAMRNEMGGFLRRDINAGTTT